jgi:hypothetical protein
MAGSGPLHRADNSPWKQMRAETQSTVDEIKQSLGLLRRHL